MLNFTNNCKEKMYVKNLANDAMYNIVKIKTIGKSLTLHKKDWN